MMNLITVTIKQFRLPIFLSALLFFLIMYPYFHQIFPNQIALVELFFALIMITGASLLSARKIVLFFMIGLAFFILLGILLAGYTRIRGILIATMLIEFMFFFIIFISLLNYIYSLQVVTINKIFASVTSFLVLGVLFAVLYALVAVILPNTFIYTASASVTLQKLTTFPHPEFFSESLYFSFVTLGTLGYGDWIPVFGPIKMVASLEAIAGQLFIAILIARLVGVQIAQTLIKKKSKD